MVRRHAPCVTPMRAAKVLPARTVAACGSGTIDLIAGGNGFHPWRPLAEAAHKAHAETAQGLHRPPRVAEHLVLLARRRKQRLPPDKVPDGRPQQQLARGRAGAFILGGGPHRRMDTREDGTEGLTDADIDAARSLEGEPVAALQQVALQIIRRCAALCEASQLHARTRGGGAHEGGDAHAGRRHTRGGRHTRRHTGRHTWEEACEEASKEA